MNYWTKLSIDYANQRNYLDELFKVYPIIPEGIRDIDEEMWSSVESSFKKEDKKKLLRSLLCLKLFPIKDSYVAYFRRDPSAIERNPSTVNRLCGRLYELGLNGIYEKCSEPKETNRQIGPLFRSWLRKKTLGVDILDFEEFISTKNNAILEGSDTELMSFARTNLNYSGEKGLDFVARFNGKYIIGEAKFLTDFGGHQNAQFNDAINTIKVKNVKAITIGVLDGVLYIKCKKKMHKLLVEYSKKYNIMSALVLREFLYQI